MRTQLKFLLAALLDEKIILNDKHFQTILKTNKQNKTVMRGKNWTPQVTVVIITSMSLLRDYRFYWETKTDELHILYVTNYIPLYS